MGLIQFPWKHAAEAPSGTPPKGPAPVSTPKDPASVNPASVLIQAQNEARKQYAPDQEHDHTYCNDATFCIARKMKAPLRALGDAQGNPYLANRMAENLAESPDYRGVSSEEAQKLADEGHLVIGAWHNPAGHGHVVTVRPLGVKGDQPVGNSGPLLNNVGQEDGIARQSGAFKAADQVHYYTPWKGKGGKH